MTQSLPVFNGLSGHYFLDSCEWFSFYTCLLNARVSQNSVFRTLVLTLQFLGAKYWWPSPYLSFLPRKLPNLCLWPRLLSQCNIQWLSAVVPERWPSGWLVWDQAFIDVYNRVNILCRQFSSQQTRQKSRSAKLSLKIPQDITKSGPTPCLSLRLI